MVYLPRTTSPVVASLADIMLTIFDSAHTPKPLRAMLFTVYDKQQVKMHNTSTQEIWYCIGSSYSAKHKQTHEHTNKQHKKGKEDPTYLNSVVLCICVNQRSNRGSPHGEFFVFAYKLILRMNRCLSTTQHESRITRNIYRISLLGKFAFILLVHHHLQKPLSSIGMRFFRFMHTIIERFGV